MDADDRDTSGTDHEMVDTPAVTIEMHSDSDGNLSPENTIVDTIVLQPVPTMRREFNFIKIERLEFPEHAEESVESYDSDFSLKICRICHLSEVESDYPLESTGCNCKGTLKWCHRRCAEMWIRKQKSVLCELCHRPMGYVIVHDRQLDTSRLQKMSHKPWCYMHRRPWFLFVLMLLLFELCTMVTITFSVVEDAHHFEGNNMNKLTIQPHRVGQRNLPNVGQTGSTSDGIPESQESVNVPEAHGAPAITYEEFIHVKRLCVFMSTYSVFMSVFSLTLWLIWELFIHPLDRTLDREIQALDRAGSSRRINISDTAV